MVAKLNFYAAGMLYQNDGTKTDIDEDKWHKFEGQEVEIKQREIDGTEENENICAEFLALFSEMENDEHFKMDIAEQIQSKLGKYFCEHLKENERKTTDNSERKHFTRAKRADENDKEFGWTTVNGLELFAEEAMEKMRQKFGIDCKKLADSFLLDELIELNAPGKSSSKFYRTKDEKFFLKGIANDYEEETIRNILKNYVSHMIEMGEKSFINKIFMVFQMEIESKPTLLLLMENVFQNDKDLPRLIFGMAGIFDAQSPLVKVGPEQRINDVVLKWCNFFGAKPPFVPSEVKPMFKEGILLDKKTHQNITERLKSDFQVLVQNNVNDWSTIFGVYFQNDGNEMPCVKKFIEVVENESTGLMEKKGRIWETFAPIPPPMYAERMLAFSMACAFRREASSAMPSEAIRQALISAFCDSYAKSNQLEEMEKTQEQKLKDMAQNKYSIGAFTVTVFGVEIFKFMVEQMDKHFWNFLNALAEDELEVRGENYEHKFGEFVVKKLEHDQANESFGTFWQKHQKTYAILSLSDEKNGKEKCQFFEVIGATGNEPIEKGDECQSGRIPFRSSSALPKTELRPSPPTDGQPQPKKGHDTN